MGEGYNNGKIDRLTYRMCSLTNPGCPGANEGMCELRLFGIAEVEEVNARASEEREPRESERSTERGEARRDRNKSER